MNEDNRQFIRHGFFRVETGNWISLDEVYLFTVKKHEDGYAILARIRECCESYIVMRYESKAEAQEDLDSIMGL